MTARVRIGPDVSVGENCTIGDRVVLAGPAVLEDDVTIGDGAVIGAEGGTAVVVQRLASIGADATVRPGAVIGSRAVVEPGSVVAENVPANAIVRGDPAQIVAYVEGAGPARRPRSVLSAAPGVAVTQGMTGVALHRLTYARDLRGSLAAAEFSELPFEPRRLFTVFDVPSESVRGAHAHRACSQFLICTAGRVSCLVDDGAVTEEVRLERPDLGLYVPPMIWGTQWRYTRDATLVVLASHAYDAEDYIRDYDEFLQKLEQR